MKYTSENFAITGGCEGDRAEIVQHIYHPFFHTRELPATLAVLNSSIPSIFQNKCINGKGRSFRSESEDTEVGHLLEHLILENLKIEVDGKHGWADFKGMTTWDWTREEKGRFNIVIEGKNMTSGLLALAIERSAEILDAIYAQEKKGWGEVSPSKSSVYASNFA